MAIQSTTSDQESLMRLGQQLSRHRLNRNLTQQELARESGIGVNTVYRIEQGHSTQLSNLIRLMRALGLANNFDQLIPDLPVSPVEQAKIKKEERRRASSRKESPPQANTWNWGDES